MSLGIGQVLKGRNGAYRLVEALKDQTVFKAQILSSPSVKPRFAVVKTGQGDAKTCLNRERWNHKLPGVAPCQYIRSLHDVIGPDEDATTTGSDSTSDGDFSCLVLEWMEHDLRTVPLDRFRRNPNILRIIAKSILMALSMIKEQYNGIHTDINPNNVFLSDTDTPSPIVKVGDLGNMLEEGYNASPIQSLPTRAPEVWRGLGCWHSSDVWSVAVTLIHWLCPSLIFGAQDKMVVDLIEAWCIAKIQRLIGPVGPPVNEEFELDFFVAEEFGGTFIHPDTNVETSYITMGTLRQELERMPFPKLPPELIDFLEHILVVDTAKRPTASQALKHPYLQSVS